MILTFVRHFHRSLKRQERDKFMRVLNVAEKNDAAKSLAQVLSNGASSKVGKVEQLL